MSARYLSVAVALCFLRLPEALAQQPTASGGATPDFSTVGVNANGMTFAQADAAIEQARLQRQTTAPTAIGVDANGTATAETESGSSDDDSFGAQMILKTQERQRAFTVSGAASIVYTDNVALTRRGTHDDVFAIADAAIAWAPRLGHHIEMTLGLRASVFRYDRTSELDFQNVGFGAGIAWAPPELRGVGLFARYDLTELFGQSSHQILLDNVLTLGAQKSFVFGRSHALTVGATAALGVADPAAAQRHQLGAFVAYHLQVARKVDVDFLCRSSVNFYTDTGRSDFNQIFSWNLRYRLTTWADLSASFSYGLNRSDTAVFDYDVLTTGTSAAVSVRF